MPPLLFEDDPRRLGELRVGLLMASALTILSAVRGHGELGLFFILAFLALAAWLGARAFDWAWKNGLGAMIVVVLLFFGPWVLPGKLAGVVTGLISAVLPRATGWPVVGSACAVALLASVA